MKTRTRRISVRIPRTLYTSLEKEAKEKEMSISELVRKLLINAVVPADELWKLKVWKIFGVNLAKVEYALSKSATVGEFLSYLELYSKKVSISPNINRTKHDYDFTIGDKVFNVKRAKRALSRDIAAIINELDKKILESYEEDL